MAINAVLLGANAMQRPPEWLVEAMTAFSAAAMLGDAFLHQLPHAFGGDAHAHDHEASLVSLGSALLLIVWAYELIARLPFPGSWVCSPCWNCRLFPGGEGHEVRLAGNHLGIQAPTYT